MTKTKIPFCDYSWNPIVGCSPCSPGLDPRDARRALQALEEKGLFD